jgi:hypothetical protein
LLLLSLFFFSSYCYCCHGIFLSPLISWTFSSRCFILLLLLLLVVVVVKMMKKKSHSYLSLYPWKQKPRQHTFNSYCMRAHLFLFSFLFSCWFITRISSDDHMRFSNEISKEYLYNEFIRKKKE